jgi:hypothetical protein
MMLDEVDVMDCESAEDLGGKLRLQHCLQKVRFPCMHGKIGLEGQSMMQSVNCYKHACRVRV